VPSDRAAEIHDGATSRHEGGRHVPFEIARTTYDARRIRARGTRTRSTSCSPPCRSFDVTVDDGRQERHHLNRSHDNAHPPMVWRGIDNFSGSACLYRLRFHDEGDYDLRLRGLHPRSRSLGVVTARLAPRPAATGPESAGV
jgi:hypothetical protein